MLDMKNINNFSILNLQVKRIPLQPGTPASKYNVNKSLVTSIPPLLCSYLPKLAYHNPVTLRYTHKITLRLK